MYKKIIIQFLLLVVLFGIILSVFFLYFNKEKNQKETSLKTIKILNSEIDNETGTLIKDINYSFSDPSGNYYELFAELGEVDIKNSDKMTNLLVILDKAFIENNFEEMWKCLSKLRFYLKHGKKLSEAMGDI